MELCKLLSASNYGRRSQLGRREIKKEATKQEILTAAAELFRTKGYESTSVDETEVRNDDAKTKS